MQKIGYELLTTILKNCSVQQFEILLNLDLMEVCYWGLQKNEYSEIIISNLNSLFFLLSFGKNHLPLTINGTNMIAEKMIKNGILNLIDKYQSDTSKEVYERCIILLETFFTTVDEDL